jgi:hypothetical protein
MTDPSPIEKRVGELELIVSAEEYKFGHSFALKPAGDLNGTHTSCITWCNTVQYAR